MKKRDGKPPRGVDERTLFRASVADAIPLPATNRARLAKLLPRPVAAQRNLDELAALEASLVEPPDWDAGVETGEELHYLRPGIPSVTLRKLRRAHWAIQAELDLHGLTAPEAHGAVAEFLGACRQAGYRCLRIIHGKGLRSPNREPVLKRKLARWLTLRDEVLAFCQARPTEGGGGAVVILIKAAKHAPERGA
jgi:DNA-nicking Smr family endonuclease